MQNKISYVLLFLSWCSLDVMAHASNLGIKEILSTDREEILNKRNSNIEASETKITKLLKFDLDTEGHQAALLRILNPQIIKRTPKETTDQEQFDYALTLTASAPEQFDGILPFFDNVVSLKIIRKGNQNVFQGFLYSLLLLKSSDVDPSDPSNYFKKLAQLDLADNRLSRTDITTLTESKLLLNLKSLVLRRNKVFEKKEDDEVRRIINSALFKNLTALDIWSTGLNEKTAEYIAALKNLIYLDAGNNREVAEPIAKSKKLKKINWLGLSSTHASSGIFGNIMTSPTFENLKTLEIDMNDEDFRNCFNSESLNKIKNATDTNKTLTSLRVDYMKVTDETFKIFLKSRKFPALQNIMLKNNKITYDGMKFLLDSDLLKDIEYIDLSNNYINKEEALKLVLLQIKNPLLEKLIIDFGQDLESRRNFTVLMQ